MVGPLGDCAERARLGDTCHHPTARAVASAVNGEEHGVPGPQPRERKQDLPSPPLWGGAPRPGLVLQAPSGKKGARRGGVIVSGSSPPVKWLLTNVLGIMQLFFVLSGNLTHLTAYHETLDDATIKTIL